MNEGTIAKVEVTRRFDATPERVFDAWLDPGVAARWLFAAPGGRMVRAEVDARVGGRFTFTDRRGDEDVDHVGEYLEIDRPRRLVFTFAVSGFLSQASRVAVEIAPHGAGCELRLTHEGILPEYRARTEEGWGKLLERLAASLD